MKDNASLYSSKPGTAWADTWEEAHRIQLIDQDVLLKRCYHHGEPQWEGTGYLFTRE